MQIIMTFLIVRDLNAIRLLSILTMTIVIICVSLLYISVSEEKN